MLWTRLSFILLMGMTSLNANSLDQNKILLLGENKKTLLMENKARKKRHWRLQKENRFETLGT